MSRLGFFLLVLVCVSNAAAEHMDGTFLWDSLPKHYRIQYTDYLGRGTETSGEFEHSNRWSAHFAQYTPNRNHVSGIFGGACLSYEHNTDGGLRYDGLGISALGGPFVRPVPWFRLGLPLRFGLGFDGLTVPLELTSSTTSSPSVGVQSFSMVGLQYGAALSAEFIINERFIIGAHGGIQGSYASTSGYYYYASGNGGVVTMNEWGPVAALAIGASW